MWLKGDYQTTMNLWRPEPETQQHMSWMFLGQLLASVTFTLLWAKGFAATACPRCGVLVYFAYPPSVATTAVACR